MKTYKYDKHSDTLVYDGIEFKLNDIKTINIIKTKRVDLGMIGSGLNEYNRIFKGTQRELTEAEFNAIRDWLWR